MVLEKKTLNKQWLIKDKAFKIFKSKPVGVLQRDTTEMKTKKRNINSKDNSVNEKQIRTSIGSFPAQNTMKIF